MQQITGKLYIGDIHDALNNSHDTTIDIIIYLGQEIPERLCFNCKPTCIHIPLIDGRNDPLKIKNVILITRSAIKNGNTILIACLGGISRSVLITTAVYALTNNICFDAAYWHIKEIVPQSQPELNLMQEICQVTEELRNAERSTSY